MRRSRNPTSATTGQASSSAASGSSNTNTVPALLKELHGLVLQIQVLDRLFLKLIRKLKLTLQEMRSVSVIYFKLFYAIIHAVFISKFVEFE